MNNAIGTGLLYTATLLPLESDEGQVKIITKLTHKQLQNALDQFYKNIHDCPDLCTAMNFLSFTRTNFDPTADIIHDSFTLIV